MAVSYNKLWKLLIDKGMTKSRNAQAGGYQYNGICKNGKNENVSMDTLARIAAAMDCGIDDIVEIQEKPY